MSLGKTKRGGAAALGLLLGLWAYPLFGEVDHREERFVIEDIRVQGLRRLSPGTVFNALPVKIGDEFDEGRSGDAILGRSSRPGFSGMSASSATAMS